MKQLLTAILAIPLFLAACSNPLISWIDTTAETQSYSGGGMAIISFSSGIPGESVMISGGPDAGGRIPIKILLPAGSPRSFAPAIEYDGKSLSPGSGVLRDFTNDVEYTVTAGDGKTRTYVAEVSVKNEGVPEIVWFNIEMGNGFLAEGIITPPSSPGGEDGTITIDVPSGTSLNNLEAKIAHTGYTLSRSGEEIGSPDSPVQTYTGSFSSPSSWTVESSGGQEQGYTVTVIREKAGDNAIENLSLGASGEIVTIGSGPQPDGKYAIKVMVPLGTPLTSRSPVITHTGVSITGTGISGTGGPATVTAAAVNLSAGNTAAYRVTAENGGYRDYTVTVYEVNPLTSKDITSFSFNLGGGFAAAGVIAAGTIEVRVPHGTSLVRAPDIYHTGVSISPGSGILQDFTNSVTTPVIYRVTAGNGSTQDYAVTVIVEKARDKAVTAFSFDGYSGSAGVIGVTPRSGMLPIVVTVPYDATLSSLTPVITHTGVSITGPGIAGTGGVGKVRATTAEDFSSPRNYTVTAEDGTAQTYEVTVIQEANPADTTLDAIARIDGFYFTGPITAAGSISGTAISVTVPYGTNVSSLTAEIYYTGGSITQDVTGASQTANPAHLPGDFRSPVPFTVTPRDGISPSATYTVTVTEAPKIPSTAKEITGFYVDVGGGNPVAAGIISAVPNSIGEYPIEVTVPSGTPSLTPSITYTGASISGSATGSNSDTPAPATATGSLATLPATLSYTVTAENGSTKTYTVTVRDDDDKSEIDMFYFADPGVFGEIDQAHNLIAVSAPAGTDLSSLTPAIYFQGASLNPPSGAAGDFRSNRVYTVKARNGSTRNYTVSVTLRPSSEKEITGFKFAGVSAQETIGAAEDGSGRVPIAVIVPENVPLTGLRPVITYKGAAITPAGGTAQTGKPYYDGPRDFSGVAQVYTVTAADGSAKTYSVTVHQETSSAAVITGVTFYAVPLSGGGTVAAAGYFDGTTINVSVPYDAVLTGPLVPTITWIGGTITPQGGSASVTHPFTDVGRNFNGSSFNYTVAAKNGSDTETYTVRVTKTEDLGLTISYVHVVDGDFLTSSLSPDGKSVTLTIKSSEIGPGPNQFKVPFEWYVDGKQLSVPSGTATITLFTSGPQAQQQGTHVVTVIAVKNGDGKHYTNRAEFRVE